MLILVLILVDSGHVVSATIYTVSDVQGARALGFEKVSGFRVNSCPDSVTFLSNSVTFWRGFVGSKGPWVGGALRV